MVTFLAKRWTEGETRWKLVFHVLRGYLQNREYDVISNTLHVLSYLKTLYTIENSHISVFEEACLPNLALMSGLFWHQALASPSKTILDVFRKF